MCVAILCGGGGGCGGGAVLTLGLCAPGYPGLPVSAAAVVAAAAQQQAQAAASSQSQQGSSQGPAASSSPEGPNSSTNGPSPMAALQSVTDNLPPGSPLSHSSASPQQRSASRNSSQLSPSSGTPPQPLTLPAAHRVALYTLPSRVPSRPPVHMSARSHRHHALCWCWRGPRLALVSNTAGSCCR